MKIIFYFFMFFSLLFAKIEVYLNSKPADEVFYKYTLKVYKNKHLIYTFSQADGGRIEKLTSVDLDKDGYKEDIFQVFTGGAHCCFDYIIISHNPDFTKPLIFHAYNTEMFEIKDINNDKIPDIITYDDYSYSFGLCFACSPYVKIALDYKNNKLFLKSNIIKTFKAPKSEKISVVFNKKEGTIEFSDGANKTLSAVLHYIYAAEPKRAKEIINRYVGFQNPATKKLFILELYDNLSSSPFWNDIKKANGWREKYQFIDYFYK